MARRGLLHERPLTATGETFEDGCRTHELAIHDTDAEPAAA